MDLMQVFNWEMVNRLRGEGEELSTRHVVRHLLYLPQGEPFERFCNWASGAGFDVLIDVFPDDMRPQAGEVPLCLVRAEPVVTFLALNDVMFAVVLQTENLKGRYVECRIIPNSRPAAI
jgi:hypothetical protein